MLDEKRERIEFERSKRQVVLENQHAMGSAGHTCDSVWDEVYELKVEGGTNYIIPFGTGAASFFIPEVTS
jgi:hypothetical protein